jgi:glycosyltransferase involved in cell wall biosynthesis
MKLSVCVITYNHELFIKQCLDSVINQKTNFQFEIIIAEDASTDNTRKQCEEFQITNPGRVQILDRTSNKGLIQNFVDSFRNCKGEYIAFVEGDDFWTDPQKLQKQVELLESQPELSCCFHNVIVKFMRTGELAERILLTKQEKNRFRTIDLLGQWFIPSGSVVFRNVITDLPDWFFHCKSGDIPFLLLLSLTGDIGYLHEVMGVYRVHDNGISGTHNGYHKIVSMCYIYESFNIHTHYRFQKEVRQAQIYEIDRHYPANTTKLSPAVNGSDNRTSKLTALKKKFIRLLHG